MYEYHWLPGSLAQPDLMRDFSKLYSEHYGTWGKMGPKPGKPVRLPPEKLLQWLVPESLVVWSTAMGQLIGYAIAVQTKLSHLGMVSWVTQLVVHEDHRRQDVGKTLLFSIWRFTDHFAWGILTASPFAVRALEKATRRRCEPGWIQRYATQLSQLGHKVVPYLANSTEVVVDSDDSRANTQFFLDHSQLEGMLSAATDSTKPWKLGPLPDGWEWFAFTFQDQDQISLNQKEITEMLTASDRLTKYAYSRMTIQSGGHKWASHHKMEVDFVIKNCGLRSRASVLDLGCGLGRHSLELAARGFRTIGVDYIPSYIDAATSRAVHEGIAGADFITTDCRTLDLREMFDAVLCIYDVIGSYADEAENLAILRTVVRHTRPGGFALISVMNMELTERLAKHWFSLATEPDRLLSLRPSTTMEKTGNIFDPEFYLIDRETRIVYRKEQFTKGNGLPDELLVRDRRYSQSQISQMCVDAGLKVVWSRLVRSGAWEESLPRESDRAKEILVLCRKPESESQQAELFT